MASLTKDELKNALVNHGVESNFASLKKDELVALYEEFVAPHDLGEFSSDDEAAIISESKPKRVSNRSKASTKSASNGEKPGLTEENSLIEVDELTDTQLASNLKEFGVDVGPIVDSTRTLYKKKLAILLRENEAKDKVDGEEPQNGHEEPVIVTPEPTKRVSTRSRTSTKSTNGTQAAAAAEFSADEEVVSEEDEEQPAIVVKKSTRASVTPKKTTSASSPSQSIGVSLRQRFTGTPDQDRTDRFTPTPRRSIHSYKVTETTTETMTKDKDGLVTRDVVTTKETTESKGVIGGARHILFKVLPWIFLLLIAAALVYYLGLRRK